MNAEPPRWVNIMIAVAFLTVGIIATSNTIRLNNYISETIPRDTEQEACQLATLQALRVWALGRGQIEDAKTARDHALYPLFEQLIAGERVHPDTAEGVLRSIQHVEEVRGSVEQMMDATPIPKCQLLGKPHNE